MAGVLQFPNLTAHRVNSFKLMTSFNRNVMESGDFERLSRWCPSLCLLEDSLYPEAMNCVENLLDEDSEALIPQGCKGNSIDVEFPLFAQLPVPIPLVQYTSRIDGYTPEERDFCAFPVENWHAYLNDIFSTGTFCVPHDVKKLPWMKKRHFYYPQGTSSKSYCNADSENDINENAHTDDSDDMAHEDEYSQRVEALPETQEKIYSDSEDSKFQMKLTLVENNSNFDDRENATTAETCATNAIGRDSGEQNMFDAENIFSSYPSKVETDFLDLTNLEVLIPEEDIKLESINISEKIDDIDVNVTHGSSVGKSGVEEHENEEHVEHSPFENWEYVEDNQIEIKKHIENSQFENEEHVEDSQFENEEHVEDSQLENKKPNPLMEDKLINKYVRKLKNQPRICLKALWNYLYGGSNGTLCSIMDKNDSNYQNYFIANGRKVRMVTMKLQTSKSMKRPPVSVCVSSVWEESLENAPLNRLVESKEANILHDIVYQLLPIPKLSMVAARRGATIDLYSLEGAPRLVESISNICYKGCDYYAWSSRFKARKMRKNPRLLSMDVHPSNPAEIVSIDENLVVRFADFHKQATVSQTRIKGNEPKKCNRGKHYPVLTMNEAGGVSYCGNGEVYLAWTDGCVYLGDRREASIRREDYSSLLDLKRSQSSLAITDQKNFTQTDKRFIATEYVNCVKVSGKNSLYYWIGTQHRVLLMDIRVPNSPVLKFHHGMSFPACYLSTVHDDNYEMVFAASQTCKNICCGISDFAHVACTYRNKCRAQNPILYCHPRHVMGTSLFMDQAIKYDYFPSNPASFETAKGHINAWTSGLHVEKMKKNKNFDINELKPQDVSVFTTNSFGDLFVQEWTQSSGTESLANPSDSFSKFLTSWRKSMENVSDFNDYRRSLNPYAPTDCSILLETAYKNVKKLGYIRPSDNVFDPKRYDPIVYAEQQRDTPSIDQRAKELMKFKGDRVEKIVNLWKDD